MENEEDYIKEYNKKVERMVKFASFLFENSIEFGYQNWESGQGSDIIFKGKDKDEKELEIRASFWDTGSVEFQVGGKA